MRKILALILVLSLTMLCGCSETSPDHSKTTGNTRQTTAVTTGSNTEGETTVTTITDVTTVTEEPVTDTTTVGTVTTITTDTTTTGSTEKETTTTAKTKKTTTTTKKTTVVTTTTTKVPVAAGVTLYGPADGTVIDPLTPMMRAYLEINNDQEAAEFWVMGYTENDTGASFTASWQPQYRSLCEVVWADNAAFANAKTMMTTESKLTITGLMHDTTYYWKVRNIINNKESEVRTVKVLDGQVRWIDADGGRNIRDLGGWKTESGKTVRYGMLYRGACIDGKNGIALTDLGKQQFRDMLGIKTQIDLRGTDDGDDGAQSSSDFGGNYVKATLNQYDYIFTDSYSRRSLGKIFDVLADESNYPIYFHCNAGADRTGTLAFIINGLLGVSHEDLTRDFELTGLAIDKRLRSALNISSAGVTWDASGVMQNNSRNYIAWGPLYNKMMTNYGTGDGKLSSAIEKFLKSQCGVTQEQINEVRRLMLK